MYELLCTLMVFPFFPCIWQMESIWSVMDLLCRNSRWWLLLIPSVCSINFQSRILDKLFIDNYPYQGFMHILMLYNEFETQGNQIVFFVFFQTCFFSSATNLWFKRRGAVDSHLYPHVLICVFLDPWPGTNSNKTLQVLTTVNEYRTSAPYFPNHCLKWWFQMLL
jgi:hypothetical protein